jgi:hypothetical protein
VVRIALVDGTGVDEPGDPLALVEIKVSTVAEVDVKTF